MGKKMINRVFRKVDFISKESHLKRDSNQFRIKKKIQTKCERNFFVRQRVSEPGGV